MSNYTIELKGIGLLYHLLKDKNMSYDDAIKLMKKHKKIHIFTIYFVWLWKTHISKLPLGSYFGYSFIYGYGYWIFTI